MQKKMCVNECASVSASRWCRPSKKKESARIGLITRLLRNRRKSAPRIFSRVSPSSSGYIEEESVPVCASRVSDAVGV